MIATNGLGQSPGPFSLRPRENRMNPEPPPDAPSDNTHTPALRVKPPILFLAVIVAGWAADHVWPTTFALPRAALLTLAAALMLLGASLASWGWWAFHRAGTSALPWRPSTAIARSGPYRFTRNPMYVGMALAASGVALALDTAWTLLLIPPALLGVWAWAIAPEERYLESRFGEPYRQFKQATRRWL